MVVINDCVRRRVTQAPMILTSGKSDEMLQGVLFALPPRPCPCPRPSRHRWNTMSHCHRRRQKSLLRREAKVVNAVSAKCVPSGGEISR